ncbi:MAG: hypothetical protein M3Y77_22920 [Actinomycetota bacterium]|nr:hypothetical protein [Actinomycetota bacterium]
MDNTATGVNSAHRCAGWTNRSMVGTLKGADGLAINATIGFDMKDAQNRTIDLATGCLASGYSTIVQLNHYTSATGARIGSPAKDVKGAARGTVSASWALSHLPANVTNVWIETYPRAYTGSPCGMSCAGTSNTGKYGRTNRRQVKISPAVTTVNLVAAMTPKYGGTTGNIQATLVNAHGGGANYPSCAGVAKSCAQVYTWSTSIPEGAKLEGWGGAGKISTTTWEMDSLASGTSYVVVVTVCDAKGRCHEFRANTIVYRNYTSRLSIHVA